VSHGKRPTSWNTTRPRLIADIWAEVLGIERVGVQDNFFDLGGDSILSIQVVALAQNRGLSLTLEQLFQHQTIQELARRLVTDQRDLTAFEQQYDTPTVTWDTPTISAEKVTGTAHISLTLKTEDERVATKKLVFDLLNSRGWWVCDVRPES